MLRVTTLYASSAETTAAYYTRYLSDGDEQPGRWTGRQAALLGVSGEVSTEQLEAVLEGRDPITGSQLGNPLADRVTSSGRVVRAVAGFDATLSAPKSLSVWWALTGDDRFAEAHDIAVTAVVDHLERYGSTTRIRSNGRRLHPDSQGLTAAVFRQTTSRLDDPQLHSHVVVSAKVQTDDGRWLALDARTLKGYQRALGGLYQSVLRAEVTARFGAAWGEIVNGQAEIAGVPDELLEQFSKRTAQVDAVFQAKLAKFWTREGRDPTAKERGALGREAAADTRSHKTGNGVDSLRTRWKREAASVGVTADSLTAAIDTAAQLSPVGPEPTSVAEIVEVLGERRSAWHRLDVTQTLCDTVRPQPGIDGTHWATLLDRATDTVLDRCVDLDPDDRTRQRRSDGRSVWIEPSARHHTSGEILAQEDHIITWALDQQLDPPAPSDTVDTDGLDLMQAEAAGAVAGTNRLVLVVGPAGAGKTRMLAAAVSDLTTHGHAVFGLAPTAKAARILKASTAMRCDTVAKLLHEHTRADRPRQPDWSLPAGATVIVDEAGMLATRDLYQLTRLAHQHQWRLALVGDHQQLYAVGRGGMFAELCATGRTIELEQIHRFRHEWEAAASLKLRHGDPTGLRPYVDHGRVHAAPFAEHCDTIARTWITANDRGEHVAITTTTNDHVDEINATVQAHRLIAGQLDADYVDLDQHRLYTGDVITTRRNQRLLRTTTGDTVRNRDYWTINAITPDGDLTVTRIDGHGTITVPHTYVTEHVQLGYAATEPGNQSETAAASITLATPATTCRGLYVAVTRGRDDNQLLAVTDTHDLNDAVDLLERILATDRANHPATHIRHELATTTPPQPTPRCAVPGWFADAHHEASRDYHDARANLAAHEQRDANTRHRIEHLDQALAELAPSCAPHDTAIARITADLRHAQSRERRAERVLADASRLQRRHARHELETATGDVATATTALDEIARRAQPLLDQRTTLRNEYQRLHEHLTINRPLARTLADPAIRHTRTQQRLDALDTWRDWANGHTPTPTALINAAHHLNHSGPHGQTLAEPLQEWIDQHGLTPRTPSEQTAPTIDVQYRPEPPGIELGL